MINFTKSYCQIHVYVRECGQQRTVAVANTAGKLLERMIQPTSIFGNLFFLFIYLFIYIFIYLFIYLFANIGIITLEPPLTNSQLSDLYMRYMLRHSELLAFDVLAFSKFSLLPIKPQALFRSVEEERRLIVFLVERRSRQQQQLLNMGHLFHKDTRVSKRMIWKHATELRFLNLKNSNN